MMYLVLFMNSSHIMQDFGVTHGSHALSLRLAHTWVPCWFQGLALLVYSVIPICSALGVFA